MLEGATLPISMKRPIDIQLVVLTPSGSLIESVSGSNPTGRVGINIEDDDGTGFTNYTQEFTIPAYFNPRTLKRWDRQAGGYELLGECSVKVDTIYADLIASGSHLRFHGAEWDYTQMEELGVGAGNDRIILGLMRKR
jgi:hypothetical protein